MILENILHQLVNIIIYIIEAMGVFVIALGTARAFKKFVLTRFDVSNNHIKLDLAKTLALGLEFKMGAEILKTLLIRSLDEVIILASIVIIRSILAFVIHWEISSVTDDDKD